VRKGRKHHVCQEPQTQEPLGRYGSVSPTHRCAGVELSASPVSTRSPRPAPASRSWAWTAADSRSRLTSDVSAAAKPTRAARSRPERAVEPGWWAVEPGTWVKMARLTPASSLRPQFGPDEAALEAPLKTTLCTKVLRGARRALRWKAGGSRIAAGVCITEGPDQHPETRTYSSKGTQLMAYTGGKENYSFLSGVVR